MIPDWTHINAVAYNAELDQIMLTAHSFNELWIIDHATTTAEAAGHAGGRGGRGGDLLYRWGNPRAYRAGTAADQRLFAQHDAHWIPAGRPGAGHVLVFNNGLGRPGEDYSSVDEIALPVDARGRYVLEPGAAYGPRGPVWSFTAPRPTDFFSSIMSGAQRLPNGNTLICHSVAGVIFEVTPKGEVVWKHNYTGTFKLGAGGFRPAPGGSGDPSRPQQILDSFVMDMLEMSPEQKKSMESFQREVDSQFDQIFTDEQKVRLKQKSWGFALPGRILSLSKQASLRPTDGQKQALAELQKAVDSKLDRLLTARQKAQLEKIKDDFGRGGAPKSSRVRTGGPERLGPGSPGLGGRSFKNPIFRAYRYGADYAGLADKDLTPGETVEELEAKKVEK